MRLINQITTKAKHRMKHHHSRLTQTQFFNLLENKYFKPEDTLNDSQITTYFDTIQSDYNLRNSGFNNFFMVGTYNNLFKQPTRLVLLEKILSKLKIINIFIAIFSFLSILIGILDYELYFLKQESKSTVSSITSISANIDKDTTISIDWHINDFWLRYIISGSCICLLIFNTMHTFYDNQLKEETFFVKQGKILIKVHIG